MVEDAVGLMIQIPVAGGGTTGRILELDRSALEDVARGACSQWGAQQPTGCRHCGSGQLDHLLREPSNGQRHPSRWIEHERRSSQALFPRPVRVRSTRGLKVVGSWFGRGRPGVPFPQKRVARSVVDQSAGCLTPVRCQRSTCRSAASAPTSGPRRRPWCPGEPRSRTQTLRARGWLGALPATGQPYEGDRCLPGRGRPRGHDRPRTRTTRIAQEGHGERASRGLPSEQQV